MRNFHIKSIIIGIGIGIILTSIISMIYTSGINVEREMTKEQIIEKAKEYGMIEQSVLLDAQENKDDAVQKENTPKAEDTKNDMTAAPENNAAESTQQAENTENTQETGNTENSTQEQQYVTLVISYGEMSEKVTKKLFELGLIDSKEEFGKVMKEMKLTTYVRAGKYVIKKGSSYEEIIQIITRNRKK